MLRYRLREAERAYFPCPDGMNPTLHALLVQRGIDSAEAARRYLNPSAEQLRDPMSLNDMPAAVAMIRAALADGAPICVYGDYDVDGVSASAILGDYLRSLGGQVEVYLPSRHREGYGLNEAAVRAIAGRAKLMVTVDCGVTSVKLVALAKSLGLSCVVTDHHQPADELPDCPVVNPLLGGYPFPSLCGAGVAFKVVAALGGMEAAMRYVDIAALATVADVVPLADENRAIVKLGLDRINDSPRPGLRALIDAAGLTGRKISAGNIAFQLAPRLNAGGRIDSARRPHELLLCRTAAEAEPIAAELDAENAERKQVEQRILSQAEAQLEGFDFPAHRALVLAGEDWNPGVIGLAASRLVEKYHYPAILLGGGDALTGSCRSIPGVDIHAALKAVSGRLVRFGGHKQAAGLTIERGELPAFRRELDEWLAANIPPECYVPEQEYDLEVGFGELTEAFVSALDALQPTGFGNPAPVLRARARVVERRPVGADGAHLKVTLSEGGVHRGGIFFRAGALAKRMPEQADALFTPKLNTYLGRTEVQLELKSVNSGDVLSEISAKIRDEETIQQEFLTEMLYNKEINFDRHMPEEISEAELRGMMARSPQGTLVLTADLAGTGRLVQALLPAEPDVFIGETPDDARAFNAVCAYPPREIPAGYRSVVLAGVPACGPLPERAKLFALRGARAPWLSELPDVSQMREVYKALRRLAARPVRCDSRQMLAHLLASATGLGSVSCAASLIALADMKLIALLEDGCAMGFKLNEARRTDPDSSAVWRTIQSWRTGG